MDRRRLIPAAILAVVMILAAIGGDWTGKGQTIPIDQADKIYRLWLPVIVGR